MQTRHHSQQGFTIVELLIAALIISVGILAWAKAQNGGIKGNATSNGITTASELAMSRSEELALESQRSVKPDNGNDVVTARGFQFARTWTVENTLIMTGVRVRIIDVRVNWNQYGPKEVRYQRVTSDG